MILVDTSVWVGFLRGAERAAGLAALLEDDRVATHPAIVGELAMGRLGPDRRRVLADLDLLPSLAPIADAEVRHLVETRELFESGLGWVDAHLLASALVAATPIWALDRRLRETAARLGILAEP